MKIFWPMKISRYAEELLARQPPPLISSQAAKPERRYHRPMDEKGLSKSVSRACDQFFRRRGM
jgi:hypothetical protein